MATRRRLASPQGQQPVTEVIASPVDTFVRPGMAGAPEAPTPIAAPIESIDNSSDLNALASAFGSLSNSLSSIGRATAQRQERDKLAVERLATDERQKLAREQQISDRAQRISDRARALRRQKTADGDREAAKLEQEAEQLRRKATLLGAEIANRVNLDEAAEVQNAKDYLDKLLANEEISVTEHPAYAKAFSVALAERQAKRDHAADETEWITYAEGDGDEHKNPGWFNKWYSGHTETRLADLPPWITDNGAYNYTYLSSRSDLSVGLRAKHNRLLGVKQRILEGEALTTGAVSHIENAIALGEIPTPALPAIRELSEGPPEERKDVATLAAENITKALDQSRVTKLISTSAAKGITAQAILDWTNNQDTADNIRLGERIFKAVNTGKDGERQSLYSGLNKRLWDDNEGALKAKIQKIRASEITAAWEKGVQELNGPLSAMLENLIVVGKAPVDSLAGSFAIRINQMLEGSFAPEDTKVGKNERAFIQELGSLGGEFDKVAKTFTFTHPSSGAQETISIPKLVKEAVSNTVARQMVLERKAILNKSGVEEEQANRFAAPTGTGTVLKTKQYAYRDDKGIPYSPQQIDLFAKARSLSGLRYHKDDGLKAEVNALLQPEGAPGESFSRRLQAAVLVYKELARDKYVNTNMPTSILGEKNAELIEIIIEMSESDSVTDPGSTSWDNIAELLTTNLNLEVIKEAINRPVDAGESRTNGEAIDNLLNDTENQGRLSKIVYSPHLGSPSAQARATKLARIYVGVLKESPENAVGMAMSMLTKNAVDVGGRLVSANSMKLEVSSGSDPEMKIDPVNLPDSSIAKERKLTLQQEHQQNKDFEEAATAYDEHYAKLETFSSEKSSVVRGISAKTVVAGHRTFHSYSEAAPIKRPIITRFSKDGTESPEWKKWRTKLFHLDNAMRKAAGLSPLVEGRGTGPNQVNLFPKSTWSGKEPGGTMQMKREQLLDESIWKNAPREVRMARHSLMREEQVGDMLEAQGRRHGAGHQTKKSSESHYDMEAAVAAGLTADKKGHWPSRVPSGTNEGLILKDLGHPTFMKTVEAEKRAGMAWYQNTETKRYYTFEKLQSNLVDTHIYSPKKGSFSGFNRLPFVKKEPTKKEARAAAFNRTHPLADAISKSRDALIAETSSGSVGRNSLFFNSSTPSEINASAAKIVDEQTASGNKRRTFQGSPIAAGRQGNFEEANEIIEAWMNPAKISSRTNQDVLYYPRKAIYNAPGSSEKKGSFSGFNMLNLATKGYREGTTTLENDEEVLEGYKELFGSWSQGAIAGARFVPTGRNDKNFHLQTAEGTYIKSMSLREVMQIARAVNTHDTAQPGQPGTFDTLDSWKAAATKSTSQPMQSQLLRGSRDLVEAKGARDKAKRATADKASELEWLKKQYRIGSYRR